MQVTASACVKPGLKSAFALVCAMCASLWACAAQTSTQGDELATGTRPPAPVWEEGEGDTGTSAADASSRPDSNVGPIVEAGAVDANPGKDASVLFDAGPSDSGNGGSGSSLLRVGDVAITEVMYNPTGSEPDQEWFEVYNPRAASISLAGLVITDAANRTATLPAGIELAPNSYGVLVRKKAGSLVPPAAILAEYALGLGSSTGIQLTNSASGAVSLRSSNGIVADAPYGKTGAGSKGASAQMRTPASDVTLAASWCSAVNTWPLSGSERGSPGAATECNGRQ